MNTFYFLRHAKTRLDKDSPISKWGLSEEGRKKAEALTASTAFDSIDVIITSDEDKAYETAKPIADRLKKEIIRVEELNELDRDKGGFLEKEEFDRTLQFALTNQNKSIHRWETAKHALERFSKKIDEINKKYNHKNILIVSHGCVVNLYFAKLLDKLNRVYERTLKSDFCDWGIVKEGKVVKDVI